MICSYPQGTVNERQTLQHWRLSYFKENMMLPARLVSIFTMECITLGQ